MRSPEANLSLAKLSKSAKESFDSSAIVKELKSVREMAKEEKDPAATKIIRLAYEYIEQNEGFELGYVEEEEIGDLSDFEYLMELLIHNDRDANKEEIKEIRDRLWSELY